MDDVMRFLICYLIVALQQIDLFAIECRQGCGTLPCTLVTRLRCFRALMQSCFHEHQTILYRALTN